MEKQQVISFLKILKIPTSQSAPAIEAALIKAGWHPKDAAQAVAVLHPDSAQPGAPITAPQVVAQVFTPVPPPPVTPPTAPTPGGTAAAAAVPPAPPAPAPSTPVQGAVQPAASSPSPAVAMQQIYRSDERLSPQTIQSLLGIDVDLGMEDVETLAERRKPSLSFWQFLTILIAAIVIAFVALLYGMYLFKVGPFHPTVSVFKW